jgi:hypothetical protein
LPGAAGGVIDRHWFESLSNDERLALRQRLWMGEGSLELRALHFRKREQTMIDLQRDFADDQRSVLEQEIVGFENAAGLRIFDWNQRKVNRLICDPVEDVTKGSERFWRRRRKGGAQRLLGICARNSLITDRNLACDAGTLSKSKVMGR